MLPCHGRDRRFESGRARHKKCLRFIWGFSYGLDSSSDSIRNGSVMSLLPEKHLGAQIQKAYPVEPKHPRYIWDIFRRSDAVT